MRGRRDHAQRRREGGIVLRRQQRRHEHEIRHPASDGVQCVSGRVGQHQFGAHTTDHTRELGGLAPIGFDGENQRHSRFGA